MPVLKIEAVQCVIPSSSIDAPLIDAVCAAVAIGAGGVLKLAGGALVASGPAGATAAAALSVAYAAAVATPAFAKLVDKIGDFPDELYLDTSPEERLGKVWPDGQRYRDLKRGDIATVNVEIPFRGSVFVYLREWDSFLGGKDDILGILPVKDGEEEGRSLTKYVASVSEGTLYLVSYRIRPLTGIANLPTMY